MNRGHHRLEKFESSYVEDCEHMENPFIIASLGIAFALLLWWAFKKLPGEEWQILASLPVK